MRRVIKLDGTWQVAEGCRDVVPSSFEHRVPVPGLLDMASPAFEEVGLDSTLREAFWYRREFDVDGEVGAVAILRILKARYGTKIFVNGVDVGEHRPNHTPGEFRVEGVLRQGRNELIVRLGPWRDDEPSEVPDGRDIESYLAVPGIYDSVELVLGAFPFIEDVATSPNIDAGTVEVTARVRAGEDPTQFALKAVVTERGSQIERGTAESPTVHLGPFEVREIVVVVPIDAMQLWSPENPFLYVLGVETPADRREVRFGMRTFTFDRASGQALLNGDPYPLRGSAVALFRFFEDPDREARPWDRDWVRLLHRRFRSMHWNTMRYAIGFPPEFWYDVADEEGLLIIDEFPLFYIYLADDAPAVEAARALDPTIPLSGLRSITAGQPRTTEPARVPWPDALTADALEPEFVEWLESHRNHPSVVMWSSNCEGRSQETGELIRRVRHLDPHNRPWGDGWNPPALDSDPYVAHWYLQWNAAMRGDPAGVEMLDTMRKTAIGYPLGGTPTELAGHLRTPNKDFDGVPVNYGENAVLLEEYGWLWLTRDGEPTRLTEPVYAAMSGWPVKTVAERRYTRARLLAAETEFFRCNRAMAGVLLFCALTSSHDRVSTADNFTDVASLDFDADFFRYVRDAFSPVAVMVDLWRRNIPGGVLHEIPVVAINDLNEEWRGDLSVRVQEAETGRVIAESVRRIRIGACGQVRLHVGLTRVVPDGEVQVIAELHNQELEVQSIRDVRVGTDRNGSV